MTDQITATPSTPVASADLFQKASRLKLRFPSPAGLLAVEDLWDLPLTARNRANLDSLAILLHRALREAGEVVSFVTEKPIAGSEEMRLRFEIVKFIIDVRVAERDRDAEAADRRQKKAKLLELIARKQDAALEDKPIEELLALAESL
jgi:hypothetical protein